MNNSMTETKSITEIKSEQITVIEFNSDYTIFAIEGEDFKRCINRMPKEDDLKAEVLYELYPEWDSDYEASLQDSIHDLTTKDFQKFIIQNQNRWEVEDE